jgi:hypothetical protein
MARKTGKTGKLPLGLKFRELLLPIFVFAPLMAILCWAAAWFFWEWRDFAGAFLGLGCFAMVVAICAYLFVLVNRIERGE